MSTITHDGFSAQIITALKVRYDFKMTKGAWLQGGKCPQCDKRELYCAAENPRMVKCGRIERCGWESSVKDALPDLFEDWSNRFTPSEAEPNATAEAYLRYERGLDMAGLSGAFSQENYVDRASGASTATVRFPVGESWWERFLDRPGRFGKKAHFKFGGTWKGEWWAHPLDNLDVLSALDEIWLAEGIFDACALRENFNRLSRISAKDVEWSLTGDGKPAQRVQPMRSAISTMSVNNYPEIALDRLRKAIAEGPNPKHRPRLIFAYDVGKAGVEYTRKFVKRAKKEGWDATAAQVRADGEGTKLDWNDQHLRHRDWKGEAEKAPFGPQMIEEYLWNGAVTIAETAHVKAELIRSYKKINSFHFRFENRFFWARWKKADDADDPSGGNLSVDEIANCAWRILYRERDEPADETVYFIQIDFPNATPTAKARFSAACCAASGEFKKRLFAFSGMWAGSQEQLDRLMRNQTHSLKTVEPIHFTGYSAPHKAWVLGDIAVHDGRLKTVNTENCFEFGRQAVKLKTAERMLAITYDPDKFNTDWMPDFWTAYGPRGLASLAYFTMSLFAVQIRERFASLPFLEIWGEAGSGKTTLIVFLWKLLGRFEGNGYEGFDPNKATASGLARNLVRVSNLPVGLIESGRDPEKTSHSRQFDWSELLTLYNGRSPRVIGVKSSGTETFEPPFLGSIYLMQNLPIDAMPAVLERLISFPINKEGWSETTREAADRIQQWPADQASGWIIHVTTKAEAWMAYFIERVAHHLKDLRKRVPDLGNDRIILNHAQLIASVEALAKLVPAKLLSDAQVKESIAFLDRAALARQAASGADHPVVQRFWELVDHLISKESDQAHSEGRSINLHRRPEELIGISLVAFEARCRAANITPPTDAELKKHLRGSKARKFIAVKPVNTPGGKSVVCWVFQQPGGAGTIV